MPRLLDDIRFWIATFPSILPPTRYLRIEEAVKVKLANNDDNDDGDGDDDDDDDDGDDDDGDDDDGGRVARPEEAVEEMR